MKNFFKKSFLLKKILEVLLILFSIYLPLFSSNLVLFLLQSYRNSERITLDKIKKINLRNEGYVPYYTPIETYRLIDGFFPLGGKQNANTYLCNEGYGLIKYKSDRFGFRNDDNKWNLLNSFETKSFFIGDSFVHGSCVNNEDTISEVYQNISGNLSFNLGISGANPVHYEAFIKMFLNPLYDLNKGSKSDNVIMLFFLNDNCRNCSPISKFYEKSNLSFNPLLNKKEKLIVNPRYSENINKGIQKIDNNYFIKNKKSINKIIYKIKNLIRLSILRIHISRFLYHSGFRKNYNKGDATEKAVIALKDFCLNKCNPYIGYIPPAQKDKILGSEKYKSHLKSISEKYDVKFFNMEDVINPKNSWDYAAEGSHLSKNGYRKIAEYINKNI